MRYHVIASLIHHLQIAPCGSTEIHCPATSIFSPGFFGDSPACNFSISFYNFKTCLEEDEEGEGEVDRQTTFEDRVPPSPSSCEYVEYVATVAFLLTHFFQEQGIDARPMNVYHRRIRTNDEPAEDATNGAGPSNSTPATPSAADPTPRKASGKVSH